MKPIEPKSEKDSGEKPKGSRPQRPLQMQPEIGQGEGINAERPRDAAPVPTELLERYGNQIEEVWWYAKGRNGPDGDPTIGIEVEGVRKTFGGYVFEEWWYFMKLVHEAEEEDEEDQCYWYRKIKIPDPDRPGEYEIVEEYVGERLTNPDTGFDVPVPEELLHPEEDLCS